MEGEVLGPDGKPIGFKKVEGNKKEPELFDKKADNKSEKLTLRQMRYVREYVRSGNQQQSYINAGFESTNPKAISASASRLMKLPKIQKAIELEAEKIGLSGGDILTPEEVLINLTDIVLNENSSEPAKLKALELLGKRYKLFTDNTKEKATNTEIVLELGEGLDDNNS